MNTMYNQLSRKSSKIVTQFYSTSFSIAVSFFDKATRDAIYSIYGFVRFADEIVDTFDGYDQKYLLEKFESDYYEAYSMGISLNPILHSFQQTVKHYQIPNHLVQAFLVSMKADLNKKNYTNRDEIDQYIYGSAEVVGLMCLRVFTNKDEVFYNELEKPAMKLGAAFQKVNFLRDLKEDVQMLDRQYFPEFYSNTFDDKIKAIIIKDIEIDFASSYKGIKKLPNNAKLAVLIAFYYYMRLLNKIKETPANQLLESRIRVSDTKKMFLLAKAVLACKLRLV